MRSRDPLRIPSWALTSADWPTISPATRMAPRVRRNTSHGRTVLPRSRPVELSLVKRLQMPLCCCFQGELARACCHCS